MKRILISAVLLCVMAAACFYSVYFVNDFTDKMLDRIHEVERAFESGETEKSAQYAAELSDEWNSFVDYAILVNDLGHAIEITSSIAEIHSFAQEGNEEIYAACDRAEAQLDLLRDMQTPTLWKIL